MPIDQTEVKPGPMHAHVTMPETLYYGMVDEARFSGRSWAQVFREGMTEYLRQCREAREAGAEAEAIKQEEKKGK